MKSVAKLETVLAKAAKAQVEELSETIRFMLPERRFDLDDRRLVMLRQTIKR